MQGGNADRDNLDEACGVWRGSPRRAYIAAIPAAQSKSAGRSDIHASTMVSANKKLISAAEAYFNDLRQERATGGVTDERSYYPALEHLLRAVGATLKPKVFCVQELADQEAGHPDFALYAARQIQKGRPRPGQVPERGVVEVKGVGDDARLTSESPQVSRYLDHYRLALVTNLRDYMLVGANGEGNPIKL